MKVRLLNAAAVILSLSLFSVANAEQGNRIILASNSFGKVSAVTGIRVIQGEDVIKLADYDEELVILDVRTKDKRKAGNIPWSEGFSLNHIALQRLNQKIKDKDTTIVIYGNKNSSVAAKSVKTIVAQGYSNVYWFKGGWPEWKRKGLKIDS